eukprot:TRINITY_DN81878_c0_g1_i1.p1 TRINITY_DN81878_c0_g1~~TRINITY_DN81878_c0_g1_i1.p1  ORF type:complete len:486 (-),score=60.67 TRINITY_DN81878_c0_g1_i1:86-1543(-)
MYIGVWPELHFAKLVKAAQAGQVPSDGPHHRSASSERSGRGQGGSGCSTPRLRDSAARSDTDSLWQVPICRRVDVFDGHEHSTAQARRRHEIGPGDVHAACRSQSEKRRSQLEKKANLPPLVRRGSKPSSVCGSSAASDVSTPGRAGAALQSSPETSRARSQPRLRQQMLQWDSGTSRTGTSSSDSTSQSGSGALPPRGPRPTGSAPPTPPGPCLKPPVVPTLAEPSGRRTPSTPPPNVRLAPIGGRASSVSDGGCARLRSSSADGRPFSPKSPQVSAPLLLDSTPPWRTKTAEDSSRATRDTGGGLPPWLRSMRSNVDRDRSFFAEGQAASEVDEETTSACHSPTQLSCRAAALPDHAEPVRPQPSSAQLLLDSRAEPSPSRLDGSAKPATMVAGATDPPAASIYPDRAAGQLPAPRADLSLPGSELGDVSRVEVAPEQLSPVEQELADEELIAWSQNLNLDDCLFGLQEDDVLTALAVFADNF